MLGQSQISNSLDGAPPQRRHHGVLSHFISDLDIPELNAAASKAHVFPEMVHHSLLSVGQLCDECYIVTFKQDTVTICDSGNSQTVEWSSRCEHRPMAYQLEAN
jgi:hypothetical protein